MFTLGFIKKSGEIIEPPSISDLVSLGILSKSISEFTDADIGTIVSIPYTDESGQILLNNGSIEFEVVGVNHHKDINDESKPTITLMSKNILRPAAFDAKEPNNPAYDEDLGVNARASYGNNRWSVSNIRQWLNSEGAANEWFTAQHEYDEAPTTDKVYGYDESAAYADDPGFLAGFSDEIKQHFATVENITLRPYVDNADPEIVQADTTQDKVFLPSYTEMNIGNLDYSYPEGSALSRKFTDESSRVKTGVNGSYWLRSSCLMRASNVNSIEVDGYSNDGSDAYSGDYGIAPVIVLH